MMNDNDLLRRASQEEIDALTGELPEAFIELLAARGITGREAVSSYLFPDISSLHSPFLLKDMDRAVMRIRRAIRERERILIYGDYDADGVTSTALLVRYFRNKGLDPLYYIPDRMSEGYGINREAVDKIASTGATLMITVDTGCSAGEEIAYAHELGIETVVTDHHECLRDLPDCCAVVDPVREDCPYPFKGLAGVGVAFKLACALELDERKNEDPVSVTGEMLLSSAVLVAIGTVGDVMPLTDENRMIVKTGLSLIARGRSAGVTALLESSRKDRSKKDEITCASVGFTLAPRVNAAGRMGSVYTALDLFLTDDPILAKDRAAALSALNEARRNEELKIMEDIGARSSEILSSEDGFLVIYGENWHEGVIGIVAARLAENYRKPVFLLTGDGQFCKGSGRCPKWCDLAKLLSDHSSLFEKYGGHGQAAGITIKKENIPLFREAAVRYAASLKKDDAEEDDRAIIPVRASELTIRFAKALRLLEPCGNGNPLPTFRVNDMLIKDVQMLSGGKHTKIIPEKDGLCFQALLFGTPAHALPVYPGSRADLVFELSINEYLGKTSVQLMLRAVLPEKELIKKEEQALASRAELLGRNEQAFPAPLPTREEFAEVYRYLVKASNCGAVSISLTHAAYDCRMEDRMTTFLLCLDVFSSAGLLRFTILDKGYAVIAFSLLKPEGKTDLAQTPVMRHLLRSQNDLR